MWIHTKYEYNSRNWKSFQSRSSTDLNQPYIHLTIKSVVLHCADDFNICLIDDDTFSKLIPSWTTDMNMLAEPMKTRVREYGMAQLIYYYGGMVVPNTFICLRNLKELYYEGIAGGTPFVGEYENKCAISTAGAVGGISNPNYLLGRTGILDNAERMLQIQANNPSLKKERQRLVFLPNAFFMGAKKNDPVMLEMVEYLKIPDLRGHFSCESSLLGNYQQWCLGKVTEGKLQQIDGKMIGVKTAGEGRPVLLEDMMEEGFLDIQPDSYGVYIPEEEVLKRNKYQWFAVMSGEEILQSRMAISKCLVESIVNYLPNNQFVLADSGENTIREKTVFTI
jgi:hypothetical protein